MTDPISDSEKMSIKVVVIFSIVIASILYVGHLKSVISDDTTTITRQAGEIQTQNQAIKDAGRDRDTLQGTVTTIVNNNIILDKKNQELLSSIANRPVAKTCDEAIINLATTAKNISLRWNK